MAKFIFYPMANCVILAHADCNAIEEVFPKNECRFTNRSWDWYLRTHKGLDWKLSYDLASKTLDIDQIPTDYADFLKGRDDAARERYLKHKNEHPGWK